MQAAFPRWIAIEMFCRRKYVDLFSPLTSHNLLYQVQNIDSKHSRQEVVNMETKKEIYFVDATEWLLAKTVNNHFDVRSIE